MRRLIKRFDALLCRAYGIFTFCDDKDCLIRLQLAVAPHVLRFQDQVVEAGQPVLVIHLWNDHMLPLPPTGPNLAWGRWLEYHFVRSLRAVAGLIGVAPRLAGVCAVGGVTALLSPPGIHPGGVNFMQHLGFTVVPYRSPLGRFGEFWENLYTWWLMWAYNPVSLRGRRLVRLRRAEIWMSIEEFLRRYGADGAKRREGEVSSCASSPLPSGAPASSDWEVCEHAGHSERRRLWPFGRHQRGRDPGTPARGFDQH